ncbi:hypothetical protein A3K86_14740 [Photobacterium jeanii]|uniref:Porin n=1 Tax=Photobacterium jeanii TaxID=858640 RepID=A0A178K902_9GAMM|nr:hypothetical protein [Photobacterium jeanii]OAN13811.1 hypothetical protein A3K86_14740 [Photobacterium jeanii]PST92727.1 hypothetical protein C9I91_06060 [Photobacterium jeanii]
MAFSKTKLACLILLACNAEVTLANDFMDGSHLEFETESLYLKKSNEDKGSSPQAEKWTEDIAQLLKLHYSSGYYNNVLGLDASYYGIGKINSTNNSDGPAYNDLFKDGDSSFSKYAYSVKIKASDDLEFKAGRMESFHPLLKSDSDGLPVLLQMAQADFDNGFLSLHGLWVEKGSEKNTNKFVDFGSRDRQSGSVDKKPIRIIGGEVYGNNYSVYFSYGNQEDISNYLLIAASYSYYINDALYMDFGTKYRRKGSKAELGDQHVDMISAQIKTTYNNIDFALSASKVEEAGEAFGTMGVSWAPGIIHGCTDESFYTSGIISPGSHYGEATYKAELGYSFDNVIEGLHLSSYYLIGKEFYNIKEDENEYGFKLRYYAPFLEGLKLEAHYGKQNINVNVAEWDWEMDQYIEETKVNLTYTALFF